jgi:hypothetical protein
MQCQFGSAALEPPCPAQALEHTAILQMSLASLELDYVLVAIVAAVGFAGLGRQRSGLAVLAPAIDCRYKVSKH